MAKAKKIYERQDGRIWQGRDDQGADRRGLLGPAIAARGPSDDKVKVRLSLSRRSIGFIKREAKSRRVPCQKTIRALVDHYVKPQAR